MNFIFNTTLSESALGLSILQNCVGADMIPLSEAIGLFQRAFDQGDVAGADSLRTLVQGEYHRLSPSRQDALKSAFLLKQGVGFSQPTAPHHSAFVPAFAPARHSLFASGSSVSGGGSAVAGRTAAFNSPNFPDISSEAGQYGVALAQFLRKMALESFKGSLEKFAEQTGVKIADLRTLMTGTLILTDDQEPRVYILLIRYMTRRGWERWADFVEAVHMAYLETKGWLDHRTWFIEKLEGCSTSEERLRGLFMEGRREEILEKSFNAFKNPKELSPQVRIVCRFVDWWMQYNRGRLDKSLSKAPSLMALTGLDKEAFSDLIDYGTPPMDFETIVALAEKVEKKTDHYDVPPTIFNDWVEWRIGEEMAEFEEAITIGKIKFPKLGMGTPARIIYQAILKTWIPLNGATSPKGFKKVCRETFGVDPHVLVGIKNGIFPTNREVMLILVDSLTILARFRQDRASLSRAWQQMYLVT